MPTVQENIDNIIEYLDIARFQINNRSYDLDQIRKMQLTDSGRSTISKIAIENLDKTVQSLHIVLSELNELNKKSS